MVGMGTALDWIHECYCLHSLPQAAAARRYGRIPVWLGDFGCNGVLEGDYL